MILPVSALCHSYIVVYRILFPAPSLHSSENNLSCVLHSQKKGTKAVTGAVPLGANMYILGVNMYIFGANKYILGVNCPF